MSDNHKMLLDTTTGHTGCGCHQGETQAARAEHTGCECHVDAGRSAGSSAAAVTPATDLVCGMRVDPATAPATLVHKGVTFYFCAPGCRRTFEKDPARFMAPLR
jgi:P-type Cu+ transporter